jgi:peptidoglycan glycosyltransferase
MHEVTLTGTAKELNSKLYTAAGKTGSAEYNDNGDSHAWFTGFAPIDDPQVCVTILIESSGSGGDYAVPIAKRIFNAYFTGQAYGVD